MKDPVPNNESVGNRQSRVYRMDRAIKQHYYAGRSFLGRKDEDDKANGDEHEDSLEIISQ